MMEPAEGDNVTELFHTETVVGFVVYVNRSCSADLANPVFWLGQKVSPKRLPMM